MKPTLIRQQAMSLRLLSLSCACASAVAVAQDFSPPPMVPADEPAQPAPAVPAGQLQPQTHQPVKPIPATQPQGQPYPQQPQQPQYQPYPQQPQQPQYQPYPQQPQQPQYQPYPQQPQQPQYQPYPQQPQQPQQPQYQPYPQQPQQPQYQQPPPQANQQAPARSVHFVGLLSGTIGLTSNTSGYVGAARVELDISRVALHFNYNSFFNNAFGLTQVHQFSAMGGYALVDNEFLRLRALAGLDVMNNNNTGLTGLGAVFGVNARLFFTKRLGLDGAVFLTPFPFRQLDLRAAFVFGWSIFEVHLGWHFKVVDATTSGSFERLFSTSPAINGPLVAVGIAL